MKYSRNTFDIQAYFYVHQKLEAVNNFSIISEDDLSRQFVYIRLQGTLLLSTQDENVLEALQDLRKNVRFLPQLINFLSYNYIYAAYIYIYIFYNFALL